MLKRESKRHLLFDDEDGIYINSLPAPLGDWLPVLYHDLKEQGAVSARGSWMTLDEISTLMALVGLGGLDTGPH